jgi:hypothetical protein
VNDESPDRKATWTATTGVAVVAFTAAVISFSHVRQLATEAGETALASWLLPISIDGAIMAAVAVILADSRAGRRPAGLTWLLLALGLSGSLAANIASAEPTVVARAVAAWPPVGLALGIEVLASLARRRDQAAEPMTAGSVRRCTPAVRQGRASDLRSAPAAAGSVNGSHAAGSPAGGKAGTGRSDRRPRGDDAAAVAVIRQLDAASPDGRASRMVIQKRLGCGGSKAARLANLARGSEIFASG